MVDLTTADALAIILAVLSLGIAFSSLLIFYRTRSRMTYDREKQEARLESLRAAHESRIQELTRDMTRTEARWMDVNQLLMSGQQRSSLPRPPRLPPMTHFLEANGVGAVDAVDRDLVMVLTSFHDAYIPTYETVQAACEELGMRCVRGDESYIDGDLLPFIVRLIASAGIVVANINGRNPNVMYELGMAQAMDKTTVLIAEKRRGVPLDVKAQRLVLYEDLEELRRVLPLELRKTLLAGDQGAT